VSAPGSTRRARGLRAAGALLRDWDGEEDRRAVGAVDADELRVVVNAAVAARVDPGERPVDQCAGGVGIKLVAGEDEDVADKVGRVPEYAPALGSVARDRHQEDALDVVASVGERGLEFVVGLHAGDARGRGRRTRGAPLDLHGGIDAPVY